MDFNPALSVIVATTRCWPAANLCLSELLPQARAIGAEVILGDGHGSGIDQVVYPEVVWLRQRGTDRLTLHARALQVACGDVIAITEDHVRPDPDWCEAVLVAHRRRPDAEVIVGAVRNGSTHRVSDRASFLLTSAPYLPPLDRLPERVPPFNNLSVKRRVLPATLRPGEFEFDLVPGLFAAGKVCVEDDMTVEHVQDVSMTEALAMHFHNGRTYGGSFVAEPRALRRRRALDALRVPRRLATETYHELAHRCGSDVSRADLAGVAVIGAAHALGTLVGLVTGRGNSPRRVT